jgi:Bifunctional DNA primase/polymerase, N-terminal
MPFKDTARLERRQAHLRAYARIGLRLLPVHWLDADGRCSCAEPIKASNDASLVCRRGKPGKHPILYNWPNRASAHLDLIDRWLTRWPLCNWAVATGPESNLLVLDVDGPKGERSLVQLERQHGPLPDIYCQQWTGGARGGWQAFFAFPTGRQIGNSAGTLGPGLDTRGIHGYVLVPPSATISAYRWATDRNPWTLPPEPPPNWLTELLDVNEAVAAANPCNSIAQRAQAPAIAPSLAGSDRYLLKALETELAILAGAPEGQRNAQLNESAFRLLRLADRLEPSAITHALISVARSTGLEDSEINETIASAARARGVSL